MREYNLLTQSLLAEGYTAEHYPDYVRLPGSFWGKNPLQNLHDGFEYTSEYRNQMVFRTGCGLLVKGSHFSGGAWFMGIGWIPENDNPLVTCPYRKDMCDLRNPILGGPSGGGLAKLLQCDCHQTEEPYSYEKSYDKACDDESKEIKRKYEEFVKSKGGHVCHWHANYNYWTGEWSQNYDPMICAAHCMNVGKICDLTHKPVSKKKGNVFYDVKTSYIRHDGTLFDGEEVVRINKGVRLFETAKSMTICEAAAKQKREIQKQQDMKYHADRILRGTRVEVLNIHAEQRESRDLMQDLQDIRDGIQITHASDLEKRAKADKKERRQQARQKRIEKLEKKILDVGYYNIEEHSLDRRHADKWLGEERIDELEDMRRKRLKEEREKPVQLRLFDIGEEEGYVYKTDRYEKGI